MASRLLALTKANHCTKKPATRLPLGLHGMVCQALHYSCKQQHSARENIAAD